MGISRRMIQRLTRTRGLLINHRPAYLGRKVKAGDVLAARIADRASTAVIIPPAADLPPLAIVYEDSDLLVVDKPAGVVVHNTRPGGPPSLSDAVSVYCGREGQAAPAHPVHRLDRDTTGLVLFARSSDAHQRLDRQLQAGEIVREYFVVVQGTPGEVEGTIDLPIGTAPGKPWLRAVTSDGQAARTRYRVVEDLGTAALLRVGLDTGRTHQIRVHMSHVGHPIVGDRQYGARETRAIRRPALHAVRLQLRQPRSNAMLDLEAPLPPDLEALLSRLREAPHER